MRRLAERRRAHGLTGDVLSWARQGEELPVTGCGVSGRTAMTVLPIVKLRVNLYESVLRVSWDDLGLDLKDRSGRARLRSRLGASGLLRRPGTAKVDLIPDITKYVERYAEQVTSNPLADIDRFFKLQSLRGFGLTAGAVATGLPPLLISPGDLRPSNTAIGTLGEAVAGWYLEQHRRMAPLARPIGEGPDMIFQDATAGGYPSRSHYALVQVKATQRRDIAQTLMDAGLSLLQYAKNVAGRSTTLMYCWIIGMAVKSSSEVDLLALGVEVR